MGFITYDLIFLVVFSLFVIVFLYRRKKNIERQGIIYLYKTKFGIRFIEKFAKKYEKILKPAQYIVLASGYILMVSMIWLLLKSVYIYVTEPAVREVFGSTPPVVPLIPYAPQLFGLSSFFPPLYFTYFIIALAVVALTHEFSHGIFARLHKFKIHSTGFVFLGPIFGAFVEPDEKQMAKAKKFPQLSVLGAGTFANVVMFVLFGIVMALFFTSAFVPAGVKFDSYSLSVVEVSSINVIGPSEINEDYVLIEAVRTDNVALSGLSPYYAEPRARFFAKADSIDQAVDGDFEKLLVVDDSPAFREQLPVGGAITKVDGEQITGYESLSSKLGSYSPGDEVDLEIAILEPGKGTVSETVEERVELGERGGKAFLGVGFTPRSNKGVLGFFAGMLEKIKNPIVYYESRIGEFGWFMYYLLWWIVMINILVALFNMLPLSILDGGRYFYVTLWGLTGSEKFGKWAFRLATWLILGLVVLMMIQWAAGFF